jgi:hypothetical protein
MTRLCNCRTDFCLKNDICKYSNNYQSTSKIDINPYEKFINVYESNKIDIEFINVSKNIYLILLGVIIICIFFRIFYKNIRK